MLTQVETTIKGPAKYLPSWSKTWLVAATRPSLAVYQSLLESDTTSVGRAALWLLASGVLGGTLNSLGSLFIQSPQNQYFDAGLMVAIPAVAGLIVVYWAIFVGCSHLGARMLRGTGTYAGLGYICAAFSAPLLVVASVASLIPGISWLLSLLYVYWFGLYVLGVQASHHVSRLKAFGIVVLVSLGLMCAFWGTLLLASFIGRNIA